MRYLSLSLGLGLCVIVAACADDASDPSVVPETDAGEVGEDGSAETDAASVGADARQDGGLLATEETDVEADIGEASRTLVRARFGTSAGSAGEEYYFEAHQGGVDGCPEKETPARTLVMSGVPSGSPGDSFDQGDGVSASYLDFTGDQLTGDNPTSKASKVKVTWVQRVDEESIELEIEATFPEGTARGRVYATHCAAMDD